MDRDGDRSRSIPSQTEFLPNLKMAADVVLLVSELEGDFDFLNGIVEDDGINCLLRTN